MSTADAQTKCRARRNYSQQPSGGRDAGLTIKWQAAYSTGLLCAAFALSQMAIGWLSINLNGRGRPAGPSIFRLGLIVGVLSDSIRLFFIARNGSDLGQRAGPRGVRAALSIQGIGLAFAERSSPPLSRQSLRRRKRTTCGHFEVVLDSSERRALSRARQPSGYRRDL